MKIRKIIVSLVVILILGFLSKKIGSSFVAKKDISKPKVTVIKPLLVQKLSVDNQPIVPKFETEGKLSSTETISVSIEGKGTLKSSILLKEGSEFKRGERIAFVEDNQANASFKASLFKYHNALTNALIDIKLEYPTEYKKWSSFTEDIQNEKLPPLPIVKNQKLNNYLSAKGLYNTYYDLKSTKVALNKRLFIAPFNGYVSNVNLQKGSFINGTTKICDISPKNQLEITFSISNKYTKNIKKGNQISITANDGKSLKAKISRIGNETNTITQQRNFTAKLLETPSNLLAGDFVKVTIPLSNKAVPATILPSYCISNNQILLIDKDSLLYNKTIAIEGVRNDSLIVTGLKNNENILLESYTNFKPEQKVRY